MRKEIRTLELITFAKAFKWLKRESTQENPAYIPQYGGCSQLPFKAWVFADSILLASNENAKTQVRYILTKEKWDAFCDYVGKNPHMLMGELAKNYRSFECTNRLFWPSIISISKAVLSSDQGINC